MKPNPFDSLNHFTVPRLRIECSPPPQYGSFEWKQTCRRTVTMRAVRAGARRRIEVSERPRRACLLSRRLLQRIDTDRCFEPCRVPALKLRSTCEATPLQVSKAILEWPFNAGPKDGRTVVPVGWPVNAKLGNAGA